MNYISDILYWISTGLLVPVIVLLIILFGRSLLLIGSFSVSICRFEKQNRCCAVSSTVLLPVALLHWVSVFRMFVLLWLRCIFTACLR